MRKLDKEFLRGSYPPLITPFKNGAVDYDTFSEHVERHIKEGSHGLLISGTTAEPSTLTIEERCRLFDVAVERANKRKPVVAATGSQSWAETIALTNHAEKAGADALLVVTPYYIKPPQRGVVEFYAKLCKETSLPVMIYHIPGRTAFSMQIETLEEIVSKADNMVGMKHAVNDFAFVSEALARLGMEFRVFVGLEWLSFPLLCIGACGLMNAAGNILPGPVGKMCDETLAGNLEAARKLHYDMAELNESIFWDTNPIPIKYMMKRMGLLADNEHRLPMVPASKELEKRLDDMLKHAGLI